MADDDRLDVSFSATLEWVRDLGVVLQSARGPVPNVAEFIAGEPIRGSWWGHPAGKTIYAILTLLEESPEIVSTRLIDHKVTLIHARVWPAVVRVSDRLGVADLAAVYSEHTSSGAHRSFEVEFPLWVPEDVSHRATLMSVDEAFALLPACLRSD